MSLTPYPPRLNTWLQHVCRRALPTAFQAIDDQRRPTRLMTRAEAASGIAVKVLVEQNQIAVVGIVHVPFVAPVGWPAVGATVSYTHLTLPTTPYV